MSAKNSFVDEDEVGLYTILHKEIFKDLPLGVVCTERDGSIILTNDTFLQMIGENPQKDLRNRKIGEFLQLGAKDNKKSPQEIDYSTNKEIISSLIGVEKKRDVNIQIIKKNFLNYPKDELYIFFISDVLSTKTFDKEKKQLEDHLSEFYKMEAIGQLAGGIAHQYNNLLGAISGYADLISQKIGDNDEKIKKYAEMILAATTRASELTRNLLIFARKNRMNVELFDATKALSDIVDFLNSTLDKKITIMYERLEEEVYIYGDKIDFQNAIMNIALNSQDAMPNGGILSFSSNLIEIKDYFTNKNGYVIKPGKYFSVAISDTGCGMSEEIQEHLFEPFFTTKEIGKGTGLGLASVYGTVKNHNGFIEVNSTLNKGTTIKIFFPVVLKEDFGSKRKQKERKVKKDRKILLVDDENILREAVRDILVRLGYNVTECADATEALSIFSSKKYDFDLIILDMKMPKMNGLDCFREMKKERSDVKVLISSGYLLEEELDTLKKEGVLGIIQKPFISSQLSETIKNILGD